MQEELLNELKRIFPTSDKELSRNLSSIFANTAITFFCLISLGLMLASSLESGYEEAFRIVFVFLAIYGIVIFVLGMYVNYKFVTKPETLEPKAKCEILKFQRYPLLMLSVSLVMIFLILLVRSLLATSGFGSPDSPLSYKTTTSLTFITGFFSLSAISMLPISFSRENQGIFSLSLIKNFEKAVEDDPFPIRAWNMLFKNAVRYVELNVRNLSGASQVDFYQPFNTVALALAMGDRKDRNSSKKWISKLIKILEKKNANDVNKAERIFKHLDSVESLFPFYQDLHKRYKLQYSIEPIRLRKLSDELVRIVEVILGIVTIAFTVIMYYLGAH